MKACYQPLPYGDETTYMALFSRDEATLKERVPLRAYMYICLSVCMSVTLSFTLSLLCLRGATNAVYTALFSVKESNLKKTRPSRPMILGHFKRI